MLVISALFVETQDMKKLAAAEMTFQGHSRS